MHPYVITALFTMAKSWKQLSVYQQMSGKSRCGTYTYVVYITMEYYSAIKERNTVLWDNMDRPRGYYVK